MKSLPICTVFALLTAAHTWADTPVVAWGGSDAIIQNFYNQPVNAAAVNLQQAANPPINGALGYFTQVDRAAQSPVFYATASNSTGGVSRLQISNNTALAGKTSDNLVFDFATASPDAELGGLVLWQQVDGFLRQNELGTGSIDTLQLTANINATMASASVSFVLRFGEDRYLVSNPLGALDSRAWTTFDISSVHTWMHFDPLTNIVASGDPVRLPAEDVTAVGFRFTVMGDAREYVNFRVSAFRVD